MPVNIIEFPSQIVALSTLILGPTGGIITVMVDGVEGKLVQPDVVFVQVAM
jgi:hypothetical protein